MWSLRSSSLNENIVRMHDMRIRKQIVLLALVVMFVGAGVVASRWRAPSSGAHANGRALYATDTISWAVQTSGIDTYLRGVNATESVDSNGTEHITVWACGSNGVILVSNDRGKTWKRFHVAGGESLDFRSIVGFDAKKAFVMSSGEGNKSLIYKTVDGGENWTLVFTDSRKAFFLDALACDGECYALSDPV